MREERSWMAVSIAVGEGEGWLRGRMARASWARSVGRRFGEMFGRSEREDGSEIEIVLLEGNDSGSKRAERMAESFCVSFEVGILVVVVVAIVAALKGRSNGLDILERKHHAYNEEGMRFY
jgi:hypothetical protein